MMRAVVWEKPGELKVTEVADPVPRHGELVVQVDACGICGTDLHIADGEFPPHPVPDHSRPRVRRPGRRR
jgi:D-arabinose 1-dehydrogenase-like Zn-dependent alcohol dehydrogenase